MERTSRNIKPYAAGIITAAALSVSPKISEETGLFEKILYEMNGIGLRETLLAAAMNNVCMSNTGLLLNRDRIG